VKDPAAHGLENNLTYQQNPRYPELKPSQYTDDTLRSIATCRALLSTSSKDSPFDPETYADHIVREHTRDRRKGWSKRFQSLLEEHSKSDGEPRSFLRKIATRQATNGSVMGCLPCGYLDHPVEVRLAAARHRRSQPIRQRPPLCASDGARRAFLHLRRWLATSAITAFLEEEVEGYYEAFQQCPPELKYLLPPYETPDKMSAEYTAYVVLLVLQQCNTLTEIMRMVIDHGHDTDSYAALAVGIASCSADYENDIPQNLIDTLDEGGTWGDEYLRDLDAELFRFARSRGATIGQKKRP
jgi:ADP-ribosyl-[dinitrogen reductase] hydrolase